MMDETNKELNREIREMHLEMTDPERIEERMQREMENKTVEHGKKRLGL